MPPASLLPWLAVAQLLVVLPPLESGPAPASHQSWVRRLHLDCELLWLIYSDTGISLKIHALRLERVAALRRFL